MTDTLLSHLLVPIANEDDATTTCEGLESYLDRGVETVTVVHGIEKAAGYMDEAPLGGREQQAENVFALVEDYFEDGSDVRRVLRYGTDVIDELVAAANEADVSAIGFTPRPGGTDTRIHHGRSGVSVDHGDPASRRDLSERDGGLGYPCT